MSLTTKCRRLGEQMSTAKPSLSPLKVLDRKTAKSQLSCLLDDHIGQGTELNWTWSKNVFVQTAKDIQIKTSNQRFCLKMPCWLYFEFRNQVSWVMCSGTGYPYMSQLQTPSLMFFLKRCEPALSMGSTSKSMLKPTVKPWHWTMLVGALSPVNPKGQYQG